MALKLFAYAGGYFITTFLCRITFIAWTIFLVTWGVIYESYCIAGYFEVEYICGWLLLVISWIAVFVSDSQGTGVYSQIIFP